MTTAELRKELGMCLGTFYKLREAGIIPAPKSGLWKRKFYSQEEIEGIKTTLKEAEGKLIRSYRKKVK